MKYCWHCGAQFALAESAVATPTTPYPQTSGFAIASLVLGILWLYWIGSILALVFGYLVRGEIRRDPQRVGGRGMATAGSASPRWCWPWWAWFSTSSPAKRNPPKAKPPSPPPPASPSETTRALAPRLSQRRPPPTCSGGITPPLPLPFETLAYAAKDGIFAGMKIPRPGPGYMHVPDWVTDEYLEQLTGEKKITVRDKRTRTKKVIYVKTYSRNEALDLTVYCHAGLFALQHFVASSLYRDLVKLAEMIARGQSPETLRHRGRRIRSKGVA